jgi:hypothetical protein
MGNTLAKSSSSEVIHNNTQDLANPTNMKNRKYHLATKRLISNSNTLLINPTDQNNVSNMEPPPECPMHNKKPSDNQVATSKKPNPGIGECPMHAENVDPVVNPLNMVCFKSE